MAVLAQVAPLPAKWPQVAQYRYGVAVPQVQDEALRYQRTASLQGACMSAHKRREHWLQEIWRLKGKRDDLDAANPAT